MTLARALGNRERYDEAFAILDHVQEADPTRPALHWIRAKLFFDQGHYQQAVDECAEEQFEFFKFTCQAINYHHLGQQDQAVKVLQSLISTAGESASYQIAEVYAQWGDADNAMIWLERAYKIRDPGLQYLGVDDLLDPISDDPRFQALLDRMNFGGKAL